MTKRIHKYKRATHFVHAAVAIVYTKLRLSAYTMQEAADKVQCRRESLYRWRYGHVPTVSLLARVAALFNYQVVVLPNDWASTIQDAHTALDRHGYRTLCARLEHLTKGAKLYEQSEITSGSGSGNAATSRTDTTHSSRSD